MIWQKAWIAPWTRARSWAALAAMGFGVLAFCVAVPSYSGHIKWQGSELLRLDRIGAGFAPRMNRCPLRLMPG